jgi:5'(3')-deoxyribonucleotidase
MIKLKNILNEVISEGVYDPGILKAVFLAGGPGSGKTTAANQIFGVTSDSFAVSGLKPVNSDKFFEFLLKSRNLPTDLAAMSPEEFERVTKGPNSERERAKGMMKNVYTYYVGGRLGIMIDGTGDDSIKTRKQAEELQQAFGYDVAMVFVNTSLEKAIDRNNNRDRKLPEDLVTNIWNDAQKAKEEHKRFFGANFFEVLNEKDSAPGQPINIDPIVEKQVQAFIRKPIQNPAGKDWIKKALAAKRSSMNEAEATQYEIFCDMDGVLCDFVEQWKAYFKGEDPDTMRRRIGKPEFDEYLDSMDRKFWNTMKWMPGAQNMWNIITKYGPKILSAPAENPDSPAGKLDWIKKNIPSNTPEVIFRKSTLKQEFSGPNKILIDDLKRNIDQWNARGGIGILHTTPQNTITELAKLGIK